jgi:hypothetical protein
MQKKREQKRQHFVPACYLKAWLDPKAPKTDRNKPYVWLFDKDGTNPKAKAPEKIFRESDMYTLTAPDGGRDLRLEHGLGTVETNFTRVRTSKFGYQRELTRDDWIWVCLFAAMAHSRTAASRDRMVGAMERVRDMVTKVAGPDWEKQAPLDPAQLQPQPDRPNVYYPQPGDFDNLKETTISALLKSAADVILPTLLQMQKTVLTHTDDLGFITSDAPSTWHDSTAYRRHPYERAVGLNHVDIEITLPISPQQCLLFTHKQYGPLYTQISSEGVDALNHRHAFYAPSKLVACSDQIRARWFERGPAPADSWEALHPNPEDRLQWTSPDCPPDLLRHLRER